MFRLSELREFVSISDPFRMYTLESNVAVKDPEALLNMVCPKFVILRKLL